MRAKTKNLVYGAILGAMYVTLTHLQNLLIPNSASFAIQCRLSEALCIFALFTPAAIPGLSIGCLLFNLSAAGALPLDFLAGSLATALACTGMWLTRNVTLRGYPFLAMTMPALTNAVLVGWELTVYLGNTGLTGVAFLVNAFQVGLGELLVLFVPGTLLWRALRSRRLNETLFN